VLLTVLKGKLEESELELPELTIHPNYAGEQLPPQNDVAIVTLAADAPGGTLPIILSRSLQPGDIVSIYGYGLDGEANPGVLRSGEMRVQGINSQFFSARFDDEGSNVCEGDSGGPAIVQVKNQAGDTVTGVVGVTSFGQVPCNEEGISGFTNLQSSSVQTFLNNVFPGFPAQ
jgi:hypothetical protein